MAAAVQTVTITSRHVVGDRRAIHGTVTYDTGDYATGGIAIAASDFGLISLTGIEAIGGSVYNGVYDHVAGKMKLYVSATGAEAAASALTTGGSVRVRAIGY